MAKPQGYAARILMRVLPVICGVILAARWFVLSSNLSSMFAAVIGRKRCKR